MKKNLFVMLAITCLINLEAKAQQGLHAGLVFQPSLVSMRPALLSSSGNDYDPDFNQTLRTSVGLYLDYHFSANIGVGVNVTYSPQGQKFLANTNGFYESHYYKFNYIKIPLFLSYNSGGPKARLIGTVGPQMLILASAKDKYKGSDIDILDNYAPLNLGFNFGLGIGFFLGHNAMVTIAPNFDIAFLNYNYTTSTAAPSYIGKSPFTTTLGIQFGIKYVKNEAVADKDIIKSY